MAASLGLVTRTSGHSWPWRWSLKDRRPLSIASSRHIRFSFQSPSSSSGVPAGGKVRERRNCQTVGDNSGILDGSRKVQCSALQCSAVHCSSALQCCAVQCRSSDLSCACCRAWGRARRGCGGGRRGRPGRPAPPTWPGGRARCTRGGSGRNTPAGGGGGVRRRLTV